MSGNIESIAFVVNKRIDARVEKILEAKPITLPEGKNDLLVQEYIKRIEGTYKVKDSKKDTDHAIRLLYIAYNTTPQEEGDIRVVIDKLMQRLLEVQQESEMILEDAAGDAKRSNKDLQDLFEDWEEYRNGDDSQALMNFLSEDQVDVAEEIKDRAEKISGQLMKIADTYTEIIKDTTAVTNRGEKALAKRLTKKTEIEEDIKKNDAEQKKLERLVADLQADIQKYQKMANKYESQAETAEERAFIMSIVRLGAEMISTTVPAIVQGVTAGVTGAATGGISLVAAAAVSTARQMANSQAATIESDNTADAIEKKQEMAEKAMEKATAETEKADLEEKVQELEEQKAGIENDQEADEEAKKIQLKSLNKRIEDNTAEIIKRETRIKTLTSALNAMKDVLDSLDRNMAEMSAKQEEKADGLRQLQSQMLDKVEKYEEAKREQAAELVKITALLVGQRNKEETIHLAIKSLGLSLKALKRMREIVVEIAFFFKCFASFMQKVMEGAGEQSKLIQKAAERNKVSNRVRKNTNDFFVRQTAEWQAVEIVSSKFVDNFIDGWSQLNKFCGTYLTGAELETYLKSAAKEIEDIAYSRQKAARDKLLELKKYRRQIKSGV